MALKNLLKSLFSGSGGGGSDGGSKANPDECIEYKDFTISPAPIPEGSQFRTAGTISREIDGVQKQTQFIRADNHASREQAVEHSISKGRQIIDEQSATLLNSERC